MKTLVRTLAEGYKAYLIAALGNLRPFILASIALFVIGIGIGYLDIGGAGTLIRRLVDSLIERFGGSRDAALFFMIFRQNLQATLVIVVSGVAFSVFPICAAVLNGMVIGYVLSSIGSYSDFTLGGAVLSMLPHGIFEIPAVILAISLGIQNGLWPFQNERWFRLKRSLFRSLYCYILCIIPLLFVAGVIETWAIGRLR